MRLKPFLFASVATCISVLGLSSLRAQVEDAPVGIPVQISASGQTDNNSNQYNYGQLILSGTFLPSSPTANDGYHYVASPQYPAHGAIFTATLGTVRIEPGKSYTFSAYNAEGSGNVTVIAPPAYRVILNNMERNVCPCGMAVTLRILPLAGGLVGVAGTASSVAAVKVDWRVSLGSLRNGDSAGSLELVDTGNGSDWTALFTPGALNYESTSDEVYVYRNGPIKQIIANQVAVDIVTTSATSYEIRCYNPSQIQSYVPCSFSGLPYVTYTVMKSDDAADAGSLTAIKFIRETRNIPDPQETNVPVARREVMKLVRTGAWPAYAWSKTDWTVDGQTPLVETFVQSGGTTQNRTEAVAVRTPGGATAMNISRSFAVSLTAGEVLASETIGSAGGNGMPVGFNYTPGGYVDSVTLPGSGWTAYDYYPVIIAWGAPTNAGKIKYTYRPFAALPASISHNVSSGEVTYNEYDVDPWGVLTRLKKTETSVNGTVTNRKTMTYGTGAYGLVTVTTQDFKSLPTVSLYVSENAADAFARGKVISVKHPDTTQQSYAYDRGTWDGTTFTAFSPSPYSLFQTGPLPNTGAVSTGLASRIAVMNGSSDYNAGLLFNTYGANPIDSLYLVDKKSTMQVTIRDERALTVRTETHVWFANYNIAGYPLDTGSWQLVSYVDYAYNWAGLLVSKTASNGAVWTAVYDGLLKTSETDEAGVTTSYKYDAAGRVQYATRAGPNMRWAT